MSNSHTKEINTQIVISLLKSHGIRKVITSPGGTNIAFVGSIQKDPFFEIYSSVDERSAAYMACGMAEDSGEPVVISCTGATAARNYISGLTEAYYRNLPILALTSTQDVAKVGHHIAQVTDRSSMQNDIVNLSVTLPIVKDDDDIWDCEIKVNQAILELKRKNGGPVHINVPTKYTLPFENKVLPNYRVIKRITKQDKLPQLEGKVAVFIGSHKKFTSDETKTLDEFCLRNNAVVFCDHTSGYKGKYRLLFSLLAAQDKMDKSAFKPDTLIHIGDISGDYPTLGLSGHKVWRVNEDGEIRDTFRKLHYVFEMTEKDFFSSYCGGTTNDDSYFQKCEDRLNEIRISIPELPFSNIWAASIVAPQIPPGSTVHLGILSSLRSWNYFNVAEGVHTASNVGGFGTDGCLSSLIGASLNHSERLYFCVLGDQAFFYDMNVMGNRHVGNNLRILVINNGIGAEFKRYNSAAAYFEDDADEFIAAAKHFGNKSPLLIKNYSENLGFEYLSASNKSELNNVLTRFVNSEITNQSMVLEIFTDSRDESKAIELINSTVKESKSTLKAGMKKILGQSGVNLVKQIAKK
ncbi:thiamine pyrophosphate-binding protein [Colwellia sp. 12G3]|uniref:thiamine pyrophosphate-binding protein n=1 Tax=Colwellia sp. 12G3 TaxID=2058299 RepID=UPI000C345C4C|nr:thiamine pyrophosphate-binding protein [Colwellia sp. 12G3]PKI17935.1 2-succinyl-5-enolpyruvyl-6-hydroxy-3-cyclohexene-1-carboxylate synthase [Colwellia sp. 12G3]